MLRRLVFLMGVTLALPAGAQPTTMVYQGTLTDLGGDPVTATVPMSFSIFATETGGASLWNEDLDAVVADGFFSVVLGETDNFDVSLFPANADRWLEVSIDGTALTPRQPLGTVPWALVCGDAQTVGGVSAGSLGDITSVTSPNGTLAGGGASGDVTLDVDYAVMGSCGDPTNDKVVGIDPSTGAVQCMSDLLGPGVPGDITAVFPGVGMNLASGGVVGDVFFDLEVPVAAFNGGTGLTGTFGIGDTYLRSDGFGGWFESNLDGDNLIPGTVGLDKLSGGTCLPGQNYARFDGLSWSCANIQGPDIVPDTVGMQVVNLPMGSNTSIGSTPLIDGDNFLMGTPDFVPSVDGVCHVTSTSMVTSADGISFDQAYCKTARRENFVDQADSGWYTYMAANDSKMNCTVSEVWPVTAGNTYQFGCYMLVSGGGYVGDSYYCRTTYFCQ